MHAQAYTIQALGDARHQAHSSHGLLQVALAQAAQQGQSAELEARLEILEARACADSPRRMTQDIAELGAEAVRAEDLNSILGRLVSPPIEPPHEEHCTFHSWHNAFGLLHPPFKGLGVLQGGSSTPVTLVSTGSSAATQQGIEQVWGRHGCAELHM